MSICKYYVLGKCNRSDCKFKHIDNICKDYYFTNCNNPKCELVHDYKYIIYKNNRFNKSNNFQFTNSSINYKKYSKPTSNWSQKSTITNFNHLSINANNSERNRFFRNLRVLTKSPNRTPNLSPNKTPNRTPNSTRCVSPFIEPNNYIRYFKKEFYRNSYEDLTKLNKCNECNENSNASSNENPNASSNDNSFNSKKELDCTSPDIDIDNIDQFPRTPSINDIYNLESNKFEELINDNNNINNFNNFNSLNDITKNKNFYYKNSEQFNIKIQVPSAQVATRVFLSDTKQTTQSNQSNQINNPKQPNMRIIFNKPIMNANEISIHNNVFFATNLYKNLLEEINYSTFKLWHNDSHLIADTKDDWKSTSKTFKFIVRELSSFFQMTVIDSHLNYYKDSLDWKPYHQDTIPFNSDKEKKQNIIVGVSLGMKREISFESIHYNKDDRFRINFPLSDSTVYSFGNDVNASFKHGIPPLEKYNREGRISIILWGYSSYIDKNNNETE